MTDTTANLRAFRDALQDGGDLLVPIRAEFGDKSRAALAFIIAGRSAGADERRMLVWGIRIGLPLMFVLGVIAGAVAAR